MIISKIKGVLSKNSSDLGLGRRPIAISDEFLESTPPSYRDIDVPFSDFFRKRYIVRERDPSASLHDISRLPTDRGVLVDIVQFTAS